MNYHPFSQFAQPSQFPLASLSSSSSITASLAGAALPSPVPPAFRHNVAGIYPNFATAAAGMQRPLPILQPPNQSFETNLARVLLSVQEMNPLFARQVMQSQQPQGTEDAERGKITFNPHNMQSGGMQTGQSIDIASLLAPPSYQHTNVPLIRILPKRKQTDRDTERDKKDDPK
jgi:hypothetical protein